MQPYGSSGPEASFGYVSNWNGKGGGPGNLVQGEVVFRSEAVDDFGNEGPVVILDTELDGMVRVYSWGVALRTEMMRADPQVGDVLSVIYVGEKRGRNGRNYGDYRAICAKQSESPVRRREAAVWIEAERWMDTYPGEEEW